MAFVYMVLMLGVYVGLGTVAICKIFRAAKPVMVAIALGISNFLGYIAIVFNGFIPSLPLKSSDLWVFLLVAYVGLVIANTIALKLTLEDGHLNVISAFIASAVLNFGLLLVLGAPTFYAFLVVSNTLFLSR